MLKRIVVASVCLSLLAVGAILLSASSTNRNIFHVASNDDSGKDKGSCSSDEPSTKSSSAGFMIVSNGKVLGEFDEGVNSVCQAACGTKQEYEATQVVVQPGAEAGDLTQCPVSGVVFAIAGGRPFVAVGDDTYHLCCDGCADKFKAEPARYVRI